MLVPARCCGSATVREKTAAYCTMHATTLTTTPCRSGPVFWRVWPNAFWISGRYSAHDFSRPASRRALYGQDGRNFLVVSRASICGVEEAALFNLRFALEPVLRRK